MNKSEHFLRGGVPLGLLEKNLVSQKKNPTIIFAPAPQFVVHNLKELRFLQKDRAQKIKNLPSYRGLTKISNLKRKLLVKMKIFIIQPILNQLGQFFSGIVSILINYYILFDNNY